MPRAPSPHRTAGCRNRVVRRVPGDPSRAGRSAHGWRPSVAHSSRAVDLPHPTLPPPRTQSSCQLSRDGQAGACQRPPTLAPTHSRRASPRARHRRSSTDKHSTNAPVVVPTRGEQRARRTRRRHVERSTPSLASRHRRARWPRTRRELRTTRTTDTVTHSATRARRVHCARADNADRRAPTPRTLARV